MTEESPPWLVSALAATDRSGVQSAFRLLYQEVTAHLKSGEFNELSHILRQLSAHAEDVDPVIAVSGLRLTWITRNLIPGWSIARSEIADVLQAKGHDTNKVLAGLDEQ